MSPVARAICALSSVLMLLPPIAASARSLGGGSGAHVFPAVGHHGFHAFDRRFALRRQQQLGGVFPYAPYGYPTGDDAADYYMYGVSPFAAADNVPVAPPHVVTCKPSREVVVVPSETGGTREIAITRC